VPTLDSQLNQQLTITRFPETPRFGADEGKFDSHIRSMIQKSRCTWVTCTVPVLP
jgi:hypothetical protein